MPLEEKGVHGDDHDLVWLFLDDGRDRLNRVVCALLRLVEGTVETAQLTAVLGGLSPALLDRDEHL